MSVAKSFQSFEFLTEPYDVGGKMYIKVRNPSTGTIRQVRWYEEKKLPIPNSDITSKPQKEVLGFEKDYITIFAGDVENSLSLDWLHENGARYARPWGWYIISSMTFEENYPSIIRPIKVSWGLVGKPDGSLKSEDAVKEAVENLIYGEIDSSSEFQGKVGERLELTLTIEKNIALEGNYGTTNLHSMIDANGNVYIWNTAAKNWPVGSVHTLKGTVKDHKLYRNVKQTVLTRCKEI